MTIIVTHPLPHGHSVQHLSGSDLKPHPPPLSAPSPRLPWILYRGQARHGAPALLTGAFRRLQQNHGISRITKPPDGLTGPSEVC